METECGHFHSESLDRSDPTKIMGRQGGTVIVFPLWKTQAWFPKLLSMITGNPRVLPQGRNILTLIHKEHYLHKLHKTLVLAVASTSGRQHISMDYRQSLLTLLRCTDPLLTPVLLVLDFLLELYNNCLDMVL